MSFSIKSATGCEVCRLPIISLKISAHGVTTRYGCRNCLFGEVIGLGDLIALKTSSEKETRDDEYL